MAQDCYQLAMYFNCGGQFAQCIIHHRNTVTSSATPVADGLTYVAGWELTNMAGFMAMCPDTVTLLGIKAKRVNNGGGPSVQDPQSLAGSRTGAMSTTAVGPCIIFPYSTGPRWFAGRTFVPGVSEDDIDNNEYVAGLVTVIQDYIDLAISPFVNGGITWTPVIWSPTNSTWYPALTGTLSLKPGVQNKRMKPTF